MMPKFQSAQITVPLSQTEAQEVGWYSRVLCPDLARDPRFYHPSRQSEVTKFMNEYFKLLDAQKMAANS